jgi:hypothetical protein
LKKWKKLAEKYVAEKKIAYTKTAFQIPRCKFPLFLVGCWFMGKKNVNSAKFRHLHGIDGLPYAETPEPKTKKWGRR